MKKTLLALFVFSLLLNHQVNAQLEKGNVLVGGDLANFSLGLDKSSEFTMSLSPKAAWFIQNNIAVGGYVSFGLDALKGNTATTYGIGPLARYYLGTNQVNTETILKHTRIFVEGNVGIEGSNVSGGASTNGLGLGIGPGVAYFITQNVGLEFLLKYNGIIGFGNDVTSNKINLGVGFQIYLPGRATKNKVMNDANQ